MTREPLTKRQKVILDFVVSSLREHGRPPTLREIGAATGITSTNGVSEHHRATVEVCVDDTVPVYDPRLLPVECCDGCVDRVRLKYPERVVADLSWAALVREEL